jgi:hypothetical protein
MLCEVWKISSPPADDGEAESHRLAPHRPVRLACSRKDEHVSRLVEERNLLARYGPMPDDAADKVGLGEARLHAGRVAWVG